MQGWKEVLFSPLTLCWKSEEQRNGREMEPEPWRSSHPLKEPSNLGPYLCARKTVAALCPVDGRQKCQNISLLICSTLPGLNTDNHIRPRSLDPGLVPSFTKVCRNQDLAI